MKTILLLLMFIMLTTKLEADYYIDGEFNGWEGETIIKLSDGTYWIQSYYYYNYCYAYNPKVQLYQYGNQIKIVVNGCGDNEVAIHRIECYEKRIEGEFEGFDQDKLFQLTDGTVWRQKNYKYWYKYAYRPKCIIYNNNGWKLSIFGKTIDVVRVQ